MALNKKGELHHLVGSTVHKSTCSGNTGCDAGWSEAGAHLILLHCGAGKTPGSGSTGGPQTVFTDALLLYFLTPLRVTHIYLTCFILWSIYRFSVENLRFWG